MEDADDVDGSDTESVAADGTRLSKKKKSQKFFCTDFPPCQLSFTRSEHLARHIRYFEVCDSKIIPLTSSENTLANVLSSAIASASSQDSIISANTLKRSTLTKTYHATPWQLQALGFNGRFVRTV